MMKYPVKTQNWKKAFGGFMNRSLMRIEYGKSPLHTIVYAGTGTSKTYFMRQYLKLYQDDVAWRCKDEVPWQSMDEVPWLEAHPMVEHKQDGEA